jgi:hypothetical protein
MSRPWLLKIAALSALALSAALLTCWGCLDDDEGATTGVKLTAVVENLDDVSASSLLTRLAGRLSVRAAHALEAAAQVNVTPSAYKLALVNLWLIKDDDTEVNIINPDEGSPTYTEASPLIIDFTSAGDAKALLSADTFEAGTFEGYKMQFLYIEMELPVVFHLPDPVWETDYLNAALLDGEERVCRLRLYFNATGKYWKRDFVVELDEDSDVWYWMRREVENVVGHRNFFIAVASNDHPPGGAGWQSTIDLFADAEFWGDEADYNDSSDPIIVGTHSTAGGVNADLPEGFTIPESLNRFYNIDLAVDVEDTMNFAEDWDPPAGVDFTTGTLDLGPGYGADQYGDGGLHPFLPGFRVTVTSGGSDSHPEAEVVY